MDLYNDHKCLRITEEPQIRALVFNWTHFAISLEDIKKAHYSALEVVKAKGYDTLIANTGDVEGVLFPEVITWWEGEMIGKYVQGGIKRVLTVVPRKALGRLSTKDWQKKVVGAMTTLNVSSMDEARKAATSM